MGDITQWSAVKTAEAIQTKKVSVREVVVDHLDLADRLNGSLNALTDIDHDAVKRASAMDDSYPGDDAPLLWGVPVTTKCNIDQKGFINSNGLPVFKDNMATDDSAVVKNLKDAGSVIIGRSNTPEFSMRWCTSNPLHGVTKNPWDETITPGGSSGGSAAMVACGVGAIGHGNDLGGSLRYPAYCCGVASIKPSMGRIPAHNPNAVAERPPITQTMSVQGPIAKTVADLRLGLNAMCARSSHDPLWNNASNSGRERDSKPRIGYSKNPFAVSGPHPAIDGAMDTAVQGLKDAGCELVEMPFTGADRAAQLWGELLFTETQSMMEAVIREHGSAGMNTLYDNYQDYYGALNLDALFKGMGERLILQRKASEMFDEVDLYLMPVSLIPPFENDLDFKKPAEVPGIVDAQKPLHLINILGVPAVAVPTGLDAGIPVGVQLAGPMHDDWFVLDVAERLEREIGTLFQNLQLVGQLPPT